MRSNCYFKLKKQLEELKQTIALNYSDDETLLGKVNQIQNDLNINTQNDHDLASRVGEIEDNQQNTQTVTDGDIQSLFP